MREARRKALAEGRDELDSRELDALPYLDAVCVRFPPSDRSDFGADDSTDFYT